MFPRGFLALVGLTLLCGAPRCSSVPLSAGQDAALGDFRSATNPATELDFDPHRKNEDRLGSEDKSLVVSDVRQEAFLQGDILRAKLPGETVDHLRERLKTGIPEHGRWAGGRIPYVISSAFSASQRKAILDAMDYINQNTLATRYTPRTTHSDYVHVVPIADGCFAYVGNQKRGAQEVLLATDCMNFQYILVHELMHAAGFEHEQTRPDRDRHVEILYDNIIREWFYAYDVVNSRDTLDLPYDIKSIMHYHGYEFAKQYGLKTLRALPPRQNEELGSTSGFTATDKAKLNAMYPLCANAYVDPALKGGFWTFGKNDDADLPSDWFDTMSSAKVTEGCTLTICKLPGFRGECVDLKGASGYYEFSQFAWDNQARSYKCKCN